MLSNAALLLASPGDVSESKRAGIQFVAKVHTSEEDQQRAPRSLPGPLLDIRHMQDLMDRQGLGIYDAVYRQKFTKQDALETITKFFSQKSPSQVYIIYYSGHGEQDAGSWVFTNDTVSCDEVINAWCQSRKSENHGLWIISDSCFSGQWIQRVQHLDTSKCMFIRILCSSERNQLSCDTAQGGDFTINFTKCSNRQLYTRAVSCEILHGQIQRSITYSAMGNYVKQNWPVPTQLNNSSYAESYNSSSSLENNFYTSDPRLYSADDMRYERLQQARYSRQERGQQIEQQRHERSLRVDQNRNAQMLEAQQSRNKRRSKTQEQRRHQYS